MIPTSALAASAEETAALLSRANDYGYIPPGYGLLNGSVRPHTVAPLGDQYGQPLTPKAELSGFGR